MSKEAGGIEPLAGLIAGPPLEAVGPPLRRSGSRGLRCSSELARSSDRRAGVRRESRCGVVPGPGVPTRPCTYTPLGRCTSGRGLT